MVKIIDPEAARELLLLELRLFGRNLCAAREQAGLYQAELEPLAEYDRGAISRAECARQAPKFATILRLARGTKVKPGAFFEGIGPAEPSIEMPVREQQAPSTPAESFGANLKWARESRELTKEELALDADVDRSTIGAIERGEIEPSLPKILKFARALDIPPGYLMQGVE